MGEPTGQGRGWLRALGLLVATLTFSVVRPGILIALPFVLLAVFLPERRPALLFWAALGLVLVVGGGPGGGMWYLERGWTVLLGGWFLGLTLRWPKSRFFPRALGAVAGSYGVSALLFEVQPRSWSVVEWMVMDRMRAGAGAVLSATRSLAAEGTVTLELTDAIYRTLETQGAVFPALLGLASLSGLGVAWWVWVRLTRGTDDGLASVRDFRFNDQLVWVFVLGVALLLVSSSGTMERLGTNAVVFMGALYALRGAGVLLFLNGGISLLGWLVVAVAFVLVAPVIAAGTLVVGLGDTWLHLRERARSTAGTDA